MLNRLKRWSKKWAFWGIVIAILGIVVAIIMPIIDWYVPSSPSEENTTIKQGSQEVGYGGIININAPKATIIINRNYRLHEGTKKDREQIALLANDSNEKDKSSEKLLLILDTQKHYADELVLQGKYKEAKYIYQSLLAGLPDNTFLMTALGIVHLELAEYNEAKGFFNDLLKKHKEAYGSDHTEVARVLNNLGIVLLKTNHLEEAEEKFNEALEIFKNYFVQEPSSIFFTLSNLAAMYIEAGQTKKAEEKFNEALEIFKGYELPELSEISELNMPHAAKTFWALGAIYLRVNRLEEAEEIYDKALEIFRKIHKPDHPNIAYCLEGLGFLYLMTDRMEESKKTYQQALEIFKKSYGNEHPKTKSIKKILEEWKTPKKHKKFIFF